MVVLTYKKSSLHCSVMPFIILVRASWSIRIGPRARGLGSEGSITRGVAVQKLTQLSPAICAITTFYPPNSKLNWPHSGIHSTIFFPYKFMPQELNPILTPITSSARRLGNKQARQAFLNYPILETTMSYQTFCNYILGHEKNITNAKA